MMYGEEKFKEMARSILPSTARKGARENLKAIRRNGRRTVNMRLRQIRSCDDYYDDDEFDYDFYPQRATPSGHEGICSIVNDRRDADNIAGMLHWATYHCIKNDIPYENRLSYIRSKMPSSIIGQHAVHGHLAGWYGFPDSAKGNDNRDRYVWRYRDDYDRSLSETQYKQAQSTAKTKAAEEKVVSEHANIINAFDKALLRRPNLFTEMNLFIKKHHYEKMNYASHYRKSFQGYFRDDDGVRRATYDRTFEPCVSCSDSPRMVEGYHDIVKFYFFAARAKNMHPYYNEALVHFGVVVTEPEKSSY